MSDEKTNLTAAILRALTDIGIVRHKSAKFPCAIQSYRTSNMKTSMTDIFMSK
jgi:hypothetical protein